MSTELLLTFDFLLFIHLEHSGSVTETIEGTSAELISYGF
jgi:hypothetical protein